MGKINNGFLFRTATYFAAILFTAGCVYGVVHYRLNAAEEDIKEVKGEMETCNDVATENKAELIGVKKDIGYLTEKVDRNYTVQQQILDEIKELR